MQAVINAIYENGVLKPLAGNDLKEAQSYRLVVQESTPRHWSDELEISPELAEEIERRTINLPDGRKIIRLSGLFNADLSGIPDDQDPVAEALAEFRRERARHFDEEWPALDEQAVNGNGA